MSRDKQIEEMAKIIGDNTEQDTMWPEIYDCANALYNAGYRKIEEDPFRRCTCLALGCDIADDLKRDVAEEIFAEIDKKLDDITIVMGALDSLRTFHKTIEKVTVEVDELKKKYTEVAQRPEVLNDQSSGLSDPEGDRAEARKNERQTDA